MSPPLLSVVTPFYNTAAFLAECIESVLGQTRGDFEYVLVDNCSTDGSGEIAESYARRDPRIRLFRNAELLPQVPNYNRAMTRISPDTRYVKVVQADDWLFPRCLEDMTALALPHPRVGLVSSYDLRGTKPRGAGLLPEERVLAGRDACRRFLIHDVFLFGSPTTVLYRADLVRARRPFYAEGRYHEDTEAAFEILEGSDFGFVHQILSYLRQRPDSIMGSARTLDPEPLDRLVIVTRYGSRFLDPAEHARCLGEARRDYYRYLAAAWLGRREAAYWDYHRKGLATIGEGIVGKELLRQVVVELLARAAPSFLRRTGRRTGPPGARQTP
jgi:glycosyltransferase involved in cell wall biosynthesis